jgi:hypothetical protein
MNAPVRQEIRGHRSDIVTPNVDPLAVFTLRCWARAVLWQACEFDLHTAVDVLQADAERAGLVDRLGQDAVQKMMADAFHRWRP